MNVRLMRGNDIPRHKPVTEAPTGLLFMLLVIAIFDALGVWKLCELIAAVARHLNGGV